MARLFIVTPAGAGLRNGNRHTALRWAALLRKSGHKVPVAVQWQGDPCDALIALHARRSYDSIARYRQERGTAPLIVTLTGTDLYRDLPDSPQARTSLELADRLIVLQEAALEELAPPLRAKTRVVYQSADPRVAHRPPSKPFRITVVAHLRSEKDPLRAAAALARLPDEELELVQIGEALDERFGREAKEWAQREPRYRWLGGLAHERTLAWMAKSHVLVVSSVMEGGANVVAEAARIGTPVIASRMPGNIGMLGARYPGYYPVADDAALAALIARAAKDAKFYRQLKSALAARRKLFAPAAERASLVRVVREALQLRSSTTRARTASLDQSSSP
ncbi:MAG TPA: selenoneine biosynthesis selenosugar synthase SenB [Burkholderiales bacterium]|nr:selenoneine biosynthesis selenosugar synthase SenB [Burkholderiales bacterium]